MHWMDFEWGVGVGWIFMLLFWGLIILGVVYLLQLVAKGGKGEQREAPLEILKKRYAKGEITKEEFEKIKDDLKKD